MCRQTQKHTWYLLSDIFKPKLTSTLLLSPSLTLMPSGSWPRFALINLASFNMVAIFSSASFLIFQFLSDNSSISSGVNLSLEKNPNMLGQFYRRSSFRSRVWEIGLVTKRSIEQAQRPRIFSHKWKIAGSLILNKCEYSFLLKYTLYLFDNHKVTTIFNGKLLTV